MIDRDIESIYLIGIGGAAMAPLAGMLAERGYRVSGSDTGVYPPASTLLEKLGIRWKNGFAEANLAPRPDLVVIGNAISRGNPELEFVLDNKIPYRSLPETIQEFFLPGHDSLVVAGTHGKTTTTSLLAWIFQVAGRRPDFLIGGVAENFGKELRAGRRQGVHRRRRRVRFRVFRQGPEVSALPPRRSDRHFARIRPRRYLRRPRRHRAAIPAAGESGAAARAHRLLGRKRHGARRGGEGVLPGGDLRLRRRQFLDRGRSGVQRRRHAFSRRAPGRRTRAHRACPWPGGTTC